VEGFGLELGGGRKEVGGRAERKFGLGLLCTTDFVV